jgi:hypothetical protein
MRMPADIQDWISRGTQLECFDSSTAQVRYATEFAGGNTSYVKRELERIFTRKHRLPVLNWLSSMDLIKSLDLLEDGPLVMPEDWHDADFAIEMMNGTFISPKWLDRDSAWDELMVDVTKFFMFLPASEKVQTAKIWYDRIYECTWKRPLSLAELTKWSVRAGFLGLAVKQSEILNKILGDKASQLLSIEKLLKLRALKVLNAWKSVLNPNSGDKCIITLAGLRKCTSVLDIDNYLNAVSNDKILNLITYLRCLPYPN